MCQFTVIFDGCWHAIPKAEKRHALLSNPANQVLRLLLAQLWDWKMNAPRQPHWRIAVSSAIAL
jgi:hypothetical protein